MNGDPTREVSLLEPGGDFVHETVVPASLQWPDVVVWELRVFGKREVPADEREPVRYYELVSYHVP